MSIELHPRYISGGARKEALEAASRAGWTASQSCDFTGSEADTVVFVGPGGLEALSRARLRLCVVLMWDTWDNCKKRGKKKYSRYQPAFREAIRTGLAEEISLHND